ncbi:MAG: hypothetical protein ACKOBG_11525 [Actinomycetota bacterium]
MSDDAATLEPPHRNGNTPHPPEPTRRGRAPWEFLIFGLFVALIAVAIIVGWTLFGSRSPERLDPVSAAEIQAACVAAQTALATLPNPEPTGGTEIITRMRAEDRVLRTMIDRIRAVRPADATQAAAVQAWTADWAAVLGARETFTARLERERRAKFVLPSETGGLKPVTGRMDDYVRQSHPQMNACLSEDLGAEAVDTRRSYPDAVTEERG